MYKSCVFLLFLLSATCDYGQSKKSIFIEKDVFQSAYFLKNLSGLIPDYQGKQVRYFADHEGIMVFFTDEGLIYQLSQRDVRNVKESESKQVKDKNMLITRSYFPVRWIGANPHPQIEAVGKNTGYYTFLAGESNKELHTRQTEGYSKVIYHNIYPGIDVEYSLPTPGGMKYNLIIHPGADASQVYMKYSGAVKNLYKDKDGNIIIHTETGDIVEHAPQSYSGDGKSILSSYEIHDSIVSFSFPEGYDRNTTLVIDPWVTAISNLSVNNLGTSVDYDTAGNLYVYGAGGANAGDLTDFHKVAKYDLSGNPQWVFMGSVSAISWNTTGVTPRDYLSNAKVDRATNKIYVSQAGENAGVRIIRLTSAGAYDNFVTVPDSNFTDVWSFLINCRAETILTLGGCTNTNTSLGFINPMSGVIDARNITFLNTTSQDVVTGTYDAYGGLYVIMASYVTTSVNNVIYKVNASSNGYVWNVPSGFNSFTHIENLPAFGGMYLYGTSNNFNGFAANASYLYYYDGYNLKAFNLVNGAVVGTPDTIPGYNPLWQGGIVVDNCNHIYLGGKGAIKTYTFNGSTFIPGNDISLGTGFSGDTILDVKYNPSNKLLYITGPHIVGTYAATFSDSCTEINEVNNIYATSITPICNGGVVKDTPISGLSKPIIAYIWEDSIGNIVRQTAPDTILADTFLAAFTGKYTVHTEINLNCSIYAAIDSITIYVNDISVFVSDSAICRGQSSVLSARSDLSGGRYLWMPGGDTTASIIVSPTTTGTYVVAYSTAICGTTTDSVAVTVNSASPVYWVKTDTIVPCGHSTLLSGTSPHGGYYSGFYVSGDSIIDPPSDTTFTITYFYTNNSGCTDSVSLRFTSTICTGITENTDASGIRLYPNPNNGSFILDAPQAFGSTYAIYNMLGQLIQQGMLTKASMSVSLCSNADGIYSLEVHSPISNGTIRFIVVK